MYITGSVGWHIKFCTSESKIEQLLSGFRQSVATHLNTLAATAQAAVLAVL
jgi:hypothetical protein